MQLLHKNQFIIIHIQLNKLKPKYFDMNIIKKIKNFFTRIRTRKYEIVKITYGDGSIYYRVLLTDSVNYKVPISNWYNIDCPEEDKNGTDTFSNIETARKLKEYLIENDNKTKISKEEIVG